MTQWQFCLKNVKIKLNLIKSFKNLSSYKSIGKFQYNQWSYMIFLKIEKNVYQNNLHNKIKIYFYTTENCFNTDLSI